MIFEFKDTTLSTDDELSFAKLTEFATSKDNYEEMTMPEEIQKIFDFYSNDNPEDYKDTY